MKKWIKRIGWGVLIVLTLGAIWQWNMLVYGIGQGIGQAKILMGARPIEEVLTDEAFPDSLKQKIELIQEIRQFAIDSLGLNNSENYTTLYDQKGKPVLWVVTACDPYKLDAYKWDYPFLGELGYQGFFEQPKADNLAAALTEQGYDTDVGTVSAWSTLGWFKDPILSNMLERSEGMLARLIIHELTHATLFIPDDADYNENLATFVGDNGAYLFLEYKYGKGAKEYRDYAGEMTDIKKYGRHVLRGTQRLDSLYNSFSADLDTAQKSQQKEAMIRSIVQSADSLNLYNPKRFRRLLDPEFLPNNTFFMTYKMYREDQNTFQTEFEEDFNSDFHRYLAHLKTKYSHAI